jgi:hypothetical protein
MDFMCTNQSLLGQGCWKLTWRLERGGRVGRNGGGQEQLAICCPTLHQHLAYYVLLNCKPITVTYRFETL